MDEAHQDSIAVRRFEESDAEAVVNLLNEGCPPFRETTVVRWRRDDPNRTGQEVFIRLVVGNPAIAYLNVTDRSTSAIRRDGVCQMSLVVSSVHRRRGIGSVLLERALSFVRVRRCHTLEIWFYETSEAVAFLGHHGFVACERRQTSHLNLEAFNPDAFKGLIERVEQQGIRLLSFADFPDAVAHRRQLFNLLQVTETFSRETEFEAWTRGYLEKVDWTRESFVLAEFNGSWIGYTQSVVMDAERGIGRTAHAATLSDYRNRGIGTALKVRSLDLIRRQGARVMLTSNRVENAPILAINAKLGYMPGPAELTYRYAVQATS